jgi:Ran GTPase-activating protein (RanGAP) involved in mRNA processing and transport
MADEPPPGSVEEKMAEPPIKIEDEPPPVEFSVRTQALITAAGQNEVGKFRNLILKADELNLIFHTAARSTVLRTLDLTGSPIPSDCADTLSKLVTMSKTLEELILTGTGLPSVCIKALVSGLATNTTLRYLAIGAGPSVEPSDAFDPDEAAALALTVARNPGSKLHDLLLWREAMPIQILLGNTKAVLIDMRRKFVSPADAAVVSVLMRENKMTTSLLLPENMIADEGLRYLADLLRMTTPSSSSLLEIDIANNRITGASEAVSSSSADGGSADGSSAEGSGCSVGLERLIEVLKVNRSLQRLRVASNPLMPAPIHELLSALSGNQFLKYVDLSQVQLTPAAPHQHLDLLAEVLRGCRSLQELNLSGCISSTRVQEVEAVMQGVRAMGAALLAGGGGKKPWKRGKKWRGSNVRTICFQSCKLPIAALQGRGEGDQAGALDLSWKELCDEDLVLIAEMLGGSKTCPSAVTAIDLSHCSAPNEELLVSSVAIMATRNRILRKIRWEKPRYSTAKSSSDGGGVGAQFARKEWERCWERWGEEVQKEVQREAKKLARGNVGEDEDEHEKERGSLRVEVLQARGIVAMDSGGTSDPFVEVSVGKTLKVTRVVKKTLKPKWEQDFTFLKTARESDLLSLVLKDKDAMSADFMGQVQVELAGLSAAALQSSAGGSSAGGAGDDWGERKWYKLKGKGQAGSKAAEADVGELELQIRWVSDKAVANATSASQAGQAQQVLPPRERIYKLADQLGTMLRSHPTMRSLVVSQMVLPIRELRGDRAHSSNVLDLLTTSDPGASEEEETEGGASSRPGTTSRMGHGGEKKVVKAIPMSVVDAMVIAALVHGNNGLNMLRLTLNQAAKSAGGGGGGDDRSSFIPVQSLLGGEDSDEVVDFSAGRMPLAPVELLMLAQILPANTRAVSLSFSGNRLQGGAHPAGGARAADVLSALGSALRLSVIQRLDLQRCGLNGIEAGTCLQHYLQSPSCVCVELGLRHNCLRPAGVTLLAIAAWTCPTLRRLDLGNTMAGDDGAIAMSKAIRAGCKLRARTRARVRASARAAMDAGSTGSAATTSAVAAEPMVRVGLEWLDLSRNNIGNKGAVRFAKALRKDLQGLVDKPASKTDAGGAGADADAGNGGDDEMDHLHIPHMTTLLKHLNLSFNRIGGGSSSSSKAAPSAIAIGAFLNMPRPRCPLQELSLRANVLGSADLAALCEGVMENPQSKLTTLDVATQWRAPDLEDEEDEGGTADEEGHFELDERLNAPAVEEVGRVEIPWAGPGVCRLLELLKVQAEARRRRSRVATLMQSVRRKWKVKVKAARLKAERELLGGEEKQRLLVEQEKERMRRAIVLIQAKARQIRDRRLVDRKREDHKPAGMRELFLPSPPSSPPSPLPLSPSHQSSLQVCESERCAWCKMTGMGPPYPVWTRCWQLGRR